MAVNAKFLSDFEDIKRDLALTDARLRGLGDSAKSVGPAMDRMVGKAPAELDRLGSSSRQSVGNLKALHGSVDQVDRVLNAAGLSLGPIPGALRELGNISGKTASDLGLLATGALAVSAAFIGWNVGRKIAELTGSDKIIGDATAALFGWGNAAKEEAAAGADFLARASKEAGREIKTMDEAIKIMNEATFVPFTERVKGAEGEVKKLTAADIAQIEAAQRLGTTTKEIITHFQVSEGALKLLAERTRDQEKADREAETAKKKLGEETKRYREALVELNASGDNWRAGLAEVAPVIQEQIKWYLEAGVSQGSLATAYQLTAVQIKAVATALKEEEEAAVRAGKAHEEWARSQVKATQEAGRLWDEYNTLRVSQGGTTTDQQIEQIERWKRESIAKLKEAGEFNEETYTAIEAVAKLKLEAVSIDWGVVGESSKRSLEQTAAKAEATYEYVKNRADQFTEAQIEQHRKIAEEAKQAVESWGQAHLSTMDMVDARLTQHAIHAQAMTEAWAAIQQEAARPGTLLRPDEQSRIFHNTPSNRTPTMGWTGGLPPVPVDPYAWQTAHLRNPPGIVRAMSGASASVSVTNNITQPLGTPSAIAAAVNDAMTQWLRSSGMRLPSGA